MDSYLRKYPGLLLGLMAAAGLVKVGALFWQEKLSTWPLLSVLAGPLVLAGLALGIGIGYDRIVSGPVARRLAPVGVLLLLVLVAGFVLGPGTGLLVATTIAPVGCFLIGLWVGHPKTSFGIAAFGRSDSVGEHVEA